MERPLAEACQTAIKAQLNKKRIEKRNILESRFTLTPKK